MQMIQMLMKIEDLSIAWDQIAPATERNNSSTAGQGSETLTDVSQQDLIDSDNL